MRSLLMVFCALVAAVSAGGTDYPAKPASVTFKKSSIWLEEAPKPVRVGEDLTVRVHYRLDASDTWGDKPTQLMCMPLGPWIDNPDGEYNRKRHHVSYPGLWPQHKSVEVGDHVVEFTFRLKESFRYNGGGFLCKFKRPDGSDWPWEWRGGGIEIVKEPQTFSIGPTALGGLFKYSETPVIRVEWGPKAPASASGTVTVRDIGGKTVLTLPLARTSGAEEQTFALEGLKPRGIFSVTLDVDGVGSDYCYFGTIPGFRREEGRPTPFGVTNVRDEDFAKIGAELGFSYTRLFTSWKELETDPGNWHLEELDRTIALNERNGLRPWICLYAPPAWALPDGMWSAGFEPSPFDLGAWSNAVTVLAKRYDGRLFGFEWLNEIVPGDKCRDPVRDYVAICRAGWTAAKAVNPGLCCQLAGGLWPHNYRIDCLNAGVGEWIDCLPVHYSSYDGVVEAKDDLLARDLRKVRVADNETASGMSVWGMPPEVALRKSVGQCRHVMTNWPDELCAGAGFVVYFGGGADPCGNWSYMLDRSSPRPVAVTLAVVQGKLAYAKPVGRFCCEELPVQLFERDGKAVAFVSAPGREGVRVTLPAKGAVKVTDYLGNETDAPGGVVTAGDMPVIVEGLDLDRMKLLMAKWRESAAKPFLLYDVDPDAIGNLVVNGGFEAGPKGWGGVKSVATVPTPDDDANHAVEFRGNGKYQSIWQGVDLPVPGRSYLYTCWMWTTDQEGGSNLAERFSDGTKEKQYYLPHVFSIGAAGSSSWRLMVKRFDSKPNTKSLGLTPVTRGKGVFRVDNVSLSLYRGSDYAAFAGRVGGERPASKVPLCCDNQIRTAGAYRWSPASLAGVASFTWDESALNLVCTVVDDVSKPKEIVGETGEEALKGDMLALAIFPKTGSDGRPESVQERWYLSLANPGGGSGRTTLFRPKKYSLGLKSGQLAKDSSVYQVDFRREGGKTVYEVRIPWSEIPGFTPAKGASFGCNLVLIDADGTDGLGRMVWGADLPDSAAGCGIVTLLP